jgi:hypothetical protein
MNTQPATLHYAEVLENFYLGIGRLDATGSAAELRRLHEQSKRDIILLNRAANALAMMDWKADPTLSTEIRERLIHSNALPDLID